MPEYFNPRSEPRDLSGFGLSPNMLVLAFEWNLFFTRNIFLYLRCSSGEEVPVDLHLIVLADEDGAYVVLVV